MKTFWRYMLVAIVWCPNSSWALGNRILVDGYIVNASTGNPVPDHPVSIRYRNPELVYIYSDHARTNTFGYFSFLVVVPAAEGAFQLSTFDCENQIITQILPFHSATTELHASFTICHHQAMSTCISDFLYLQSPAEPGKFYFKQAALGDIGGWFWDFGDGHSSSLPDPVHVYEQDGHFKVCLTVTSQDGSCSHTHCSYLDSVDDTLLVARFTFYPLPGHEKTYQFVDLSSGNVTEWLWDFGDGRSVSLQNPIYTFQDYGVYNVCLTVRKSGNLSQTSCRDVLVEDLKFCPLSFRYFSDPVQFNTLYFLDYSFDEADQWFWDFGNGYISQEQKPVYTFPSDGIYTVTLNAFSQSSGCSANYARVVQVGAIPEPKSMFRFANHPENPLICQFVAVPKGNPDFWLWDFGDGNTSTLENPVHVYATEGVYQVCLTIGYQNSSQNDIFCKTLSLISPSNCAAYFRYRPETSDPLIIHFTNISGGGSGSYLWDFGDGHTSTVENPSHSYAMPGFYRVTLTVYDTLMGCSESWSEVVLAGHLSPLQPDFAALLPDPSQTVVHFFDLSTGTFDVKIWSFGDGNFSFASHPTHIYLQPGTYMVGLHLEDSRTRVTRQIWKQILVGLPEVCEADFIKLPSIHHPLFFRMVDQSAGSHLNYLWDFGNNSTSTLKNPLVEFPGEGAYQVCLTIGNSTGSCNDELCKELQIVIEQKCQADFQAILPQGQDLRVEFFDNSLGIMNSWWWDFGDGNFSELRNPVHYYADSGLYQVKLTVFHTDSVLWCQSEKTILIPVYAPAPICVVDFTAFPDSGINRPYKFHFRNLSSPSDAHWFWDFGDGHHSLLFEPVHQFTHQGPYQVELTMNISNPYGQGCTGTKKLSFTAPQYYHLGGLVFAGLFPLNNPYFTGDTAEVFFYRQHNGKIIPLDTMKFTHYGYYYALYLLSGHYLIKAQLTRHSPRFDEYFPTYLGNQIIWENATFCHLADSNQYHCHIHLKPVPVIPTGNGSITGRVYFVQQKAMIPAAHTVVLLFNEQMIPLKYHITDQYGGFTFYQLPMGKYYLGAESAGKVFSPELVVLSEEFPELKDIELFLMDSEPSGKKEMMPVSTEVTVFPNPVSDFLFVRFRIDQPQSVYISVTDISGRFLLGQILPSVSPGIHQVALPMTILPHGMYFLSLEPSLASPRVIKFIK